MRLPIRFIEADYCPMTSQGGWIVPLNGVRAPRPDPDDVRVALNQIGLVEGVDYRMYTTGLSDAYLTRVILVSDENFIMAKVGLS